MARKLTASFIRDESGNVLATLVACMAVILVASTATIDFSDWHALHRQAQLRADAAAMAAANCLAHPFMGTSVRCSSPVDTADATAAALHTAGNTVSVRVTGTPAYVYASGNSTVTQVTVTMRGRASGLFPGLEPKVVATATVSITMPTGIGSGNVELL